MTRRDQFMNASDITILDGGMGQELVHRSGDEPSRLWSAQVLMDNPELVRDVHVDFINAGADVITTNSYSATRCRLGPVDREDEYELLQRRACELAAAARDIANKDVLIAGGLSPYGWTYRPELAPPFDDLWPQYAETAAIQAPFVDLFLCETMGSIEEARAAVFGAQQTGKPVWVAWTIHDDETVRLRSGEPLAEAIRRIADLEVEAVLLNCSIPEAITAAIPTLTTAPTVVGAYANGFTHIAADYEQGDVTSKLDARQDITPDAYAEIGLAWIAAGAQIVGGCCEIGPAHIERLASAIRQLN
jgi:S-methylmethionine-dependent homocysteine/selenocysteine methylase